MADKKAKAPLFKTPKGTFKFPRLGEPDTKFKAEGEYSVKLILSADDAVKLEAKLAPLHKQAIADGKAAYAELPVASRKKMEAKGGGFTANPLSTPVYDDNENETGEVEFNFKMSASGEYKKGPKAGQKWTRRPDVFDAKGQKMDGGKVWGGSVGIVAFEASPYFVPGTGAAGLSLRLKAVQVVELVSGGSRNASAYGFEAEEGYEDESSALPDETGSEVEGDGSSDF